MQSTITNDFPYVSIDGNPNFFLMPMFLLKVSVQELHISMVIHPEEGGAKETSDEENNIIIIDSTLQNILPPQLKKMTS